jgi:hypothetical protein
MLNYNLNIIEPLQQEKKNEDVRPPIYWTFNSYATASDSTDLGELGFATMSINAPLTNCIQVSNDSSGDFATDAQFPVTASLTGSNWPITGSTTMSLYTAGITYDPVAVNQYYFQAISASALDIYNNPSYTGSILLNQYSASEFFRFYTEATIIHTKGNIFNPVIKWLAKNESPSTTTGNVNGFTSSFNIVKDRNVSLVSLPQLTGSNAGQFNNLYALNITSSLSASVINNTTGSTTMSISIPEVGISTSSLLFNKTSVGLRTISASFVASQNTGYNITASVIMNKGNIWNAKLKYLATGSNADSYSMYTIPSQFNLFKDVNVDNTVIDQNVLLVRSDLTSSVTGEVQTQYAFNFQTDVTESNTYPITQVYTYPTTSLDVQPNVYNNTVYNSGSILTATELPDGAEYVITASAWINKIPAFDASIIVLGGGGGGGGGLTNGNAPLNRPVAGGGGGAGGFFQYDFQLVPNLSYTIESVGTSGTGSNSGGINGQNGGHTILKVWLGPYPANGTGSLTAFGGQGGQINPNNPPTNTQFFNQYGGASGGGNLSYYLNGVSTIIAEKPAIAGGASELDIAAGGGGGITGSGAYGGSTPNGGFNLGGGGGISTAFSAGTGSIAPTIYFQSSSFTWTGSAGSGSSNGNGFNSTALGGGGGGAYASSSLSGGSGSMGAVIIAYSGSAKLNVPAGTITTFSNGVTWHLIKTTGSFSYDYQPKPNPEEQKYIWRTETLVVAGGGSGGTDEGGGGGAGGYSYNPYVGYQIGKTYSVNVGIGQPGTNSISSSQSGSNSYITDTSNGQILIFSKGGGAGFAQDGGSGGGASNNGNGGQVFNGFINPNYYVTSSQVQGFFGGAASEAGKEAGGGGGASATGSAGGFSPSSPGVGGIGKYDISFTPIGVCGGGNSWNAVFNGPNVSVFGGGDGATVVDTPATGSNAAPNRGGGGGGARGVGPAGGSGGSGKVQIKYAGYERATGGQIQTQLVSGSYYTLHTFTASGNFIPYK